MNNLEHQQEIFINFKPYKTTYEGNWKGYQFELHQFRDENWEIEWLDKPYDFPKMEKDIEEEIHSWFLENFKNI